MAGISAFPACATARFEIQETALTSWRVEYTACSLLGDLHTTPPASRGDRRGDVAGKKRREEGNRRRLGAHRAWVS